MKMLNEKIEEVKEMLIIGSWSGISLLQLDNTIQKFLETEDSIFDYGCDEIEYFVYDIHEFAYRIPVLNKLDSDGEYVETDENGDYLEIVECNVKFKVIDDNTENIENIIVEVTEIETL